MIEEIPSADSVSRWIDSPHKWNREQEQFIDHNLFMLQKPDEVESLVWRKYAVEIEAVHQLGCIQQSAKRERRPEWTYMGAITAIVTDIRNIRSVQQDAFDVIHAPEEGQHHAHICYVMQEGTELLKQRKMDLKERLRKVFGPLEAYACPNLVG